MLIISLCAGADSIGHGFRLPRSLLSLYPCWLLHPKFVFTHFVNAPGQGIKSQDLVVLLGLPYFQSILACFEVGTHVLEEVKKTALSGPRAMIRTVYVTASVEIVLLLVHTFCIQIPANVLRQYSYRCWRLFCCQSNLSRRLQCKIWQ